MRARLKVGIVPMMLMSGLAGCAGPKTPAPSTSSPQAKQAAPAIGGPTILLIGTSLTAGYGLEPADAWPAHIQAMIDSAQLGFRVVNAGVSGESSADTRGRLDWLLSSGPPSVVVVEIGANDALRGQPPDSLRANLDAILARLEAVTPRPVLVLAGMEALPNLGRSYAEHVRKIFPDVARAHKAVYLPFLLAGVAGVDSLNQADGIHPNAAGSRRVAANVWKTLRPILDSLAHQG